MTEVIQKRIEPLFFINGDVDQNEKFLTTLDVCYAVRDVVGSESYIDGAQKIGGVWRIYMLDAVARAQVLATGISLRDTQVTIYDRNPFLTPHLRLGQEDLETTRLYVRNIPLSYDNEVISGYLKDMNVEMLGNLKYCRARTPEGKLTNFKTGDRFVEIVVPDEPLPKKKEMGYSQHPSITNSKDKQRKRKYAEIVTKPGTFVETARMKLYVLSVTSQVTRGVVHCAGV